MRKITEEEKEILDEVIEECEKDIRSGVLEEMHKTVYGMRSTQIGSLILYLIRRGIIEKIEKIKKKRN